MTQKSKQDVNEVQSENLALDDARRLKVLSPGMLILRRFLRNRLAIAGVIILIAMFIFSFIGGLISPYGEYETFRKEISAESDFGGVTVNDDFRYDSIPGESFPMTARSQFMANLGSDSTLFTDSGNSYGYEMINEDAYLISSQVPIARGLSMGPKAIMTFEEGIEPIDGLEDAVGQAIQDGEETVEVNGETFDVDAEGKEFMVSQSMPTTLAAKRSLSFDSPEDDLGIGFQAAAERAIAADDTEFTFEDATYDLDKRSEKSYEISQDGELVALLSNFIVQPLRTNDFLDLEFKEAAISAVANHDDAFEYQGDTYPLRYHNRQVDIRYETVQTVYDDYADPSPEHPLGTDVNGMDILTRLMYGGRVSLLVGFISVIISMVIGVILGGLAGYFGGWVDMLVMRLVDISYCIPTYPILFIAGSLMDEFQLDPTSRMMYLMGILGILGWSGIARMVRGQILSLREQEFMTAAEATGLSVKRRIFKHLVPNVIPQLIVIATMSLGGTIITESTLSFLGLGVKFPYATWGNIINSVSNVHVMTNYPYAWIPAGICMLITVLAFNFVGDGLRDAFDPRMKR